MTTDCYSVDYTEKPNWCPRWFWYMAVRVMIDQNYAARLLLWSGIGACVFILASYGAFAIWFIYFR